jgi:hypothetical protein
VTDNNTILGTGVTFSIEVTENNFYPIGCAKSCTFEIDQEIILRTGVNDGLFPKKRVIRTDWRGSGTFVMVSNNTNDRYSAFYLAKEAVRRAESRYQWEFTDQDGNIKTITGYAVIKGLPISADVQAFSSFDLQIEGSGAFTLSDGGGSPSSISDENVDSDEWTVTAGQYGISGLSVDGKSLVGKYLLAVSRTGTPHEIITSGTVGNLQAKFSSGAGTIVFDIPLNDGEVVWAMWRDA